MTEPAHRLWSTDEQRWIYPDELDYVDVMQVIRAEMDRQEVEDRRPEGGFRSNYDLTKIAQAVAAAGLGKPPPKPTVPSFDPAWDKSPDEIARIQANPNPSRLGKPQ